MRHHDHNRKFGRKKEQRVALLNSLAKSLMEKGRIKTTEAKAKELRPFVEKLITKTRDSKNPHKLSGRSGGYTRIIKLERRKSDSSKMAVIEFVEVE